MIRFKCKTSLKTRVLSLMFMQIFALSYNVLGRSWGHSGLRACMALSWGCCSGAVYVMGQLGLLSWNLDECCAQALHLLLLTGCGWIA